MSQTERKMRRAGIVVLQVYEKYDAKVAEGVAAKGATCKEGCAHCCRLPASTTVAEMGPIVTALAGHADWEEKLRPALERTVATQLFEMSSVNMMDDDERAAFFERQMPCMFLGDDERCKVYELRPAACRYHFVVTPPENCSALAADSTVARIDLRKLEDMVMLVGAHELGSIFAGPLPAAFAVAAKMLGVEFNADEVALRRSMFPRAKIQK